MTLSAVTANRIVFVLSLLGAGVALYLTLAHMNYLSLTCGQIPGCAEVAAHPTSRGFGIRGLEYIPTALFGVAAFTALAASSFFRAATASSRADLLTARMQWLVSLGAIIVSAYLTYLEAVVIRAWCQWCVISAVVTVLIFVVLSAGQPRNAAAAPSPSPSDRSEEPAS